MISNSESILTICKDIPDFDSIVKIEAISKGLSGDNKYCVETAQGQRYLLRISAIDTYERKKAMYDMMLRVNSFGVSMSSPIDIGICNEGRNVYQLLSWCEGVSADILLPNLSHTEQYELGLKAGQNLRRIHSLPAADNTLDWYDRFVSITDKALRAFFKCGIHIEGSDTILAYYEENRYLLRGRPQCFIHGDYHNDNLIITPNREFKAIDWDLLDSLYADPWSEFNRILHTKLVSHFTSGQIHGYFGGEPPEEFLRILALYLSVGALVLVNWAVYVEPGCMEECIQTANNVVSWYDGMRNTVPNWYLKV